MSERVSERVSEYSSDGSSSGVSEPGPTRAWALASKAIVNYIHK